MMNNIDGKWLNRWFEEARQKSLWSKDPSKQIGAIAIGESKQILSVGYNGFPRGILDTPERYQDRETKYKYVVHAEKNLIYNACLTGTSLKGATIFVHGLPVCAECMKGLIQVQVAQIYSLGEINERWIESTEFAKSLAREANIIYEHFDLTK
jgi:dCMP deaminase